MMRFQRSHFAFVLCFANCHCGRRLLLRKTVLCFRPVSVSVTSILQKRKSFQDLFSQDVSYEPAENLSIETSDITDKLEETNSVDKSLRYIINPSVKEHKTSNYSTISFGLLFAWGPEQTDVLHEILEQSFQSYKTIYSKKDLLQSLGKVSENEFSSALKLNYRLISHEELVNALFCITSYTVHSNLTFNTPSYTPLCDAIVDNMNEFSDQQLLKIGIILYHWPKENESPRKELAIAVEEECVQRHIKYWCTRKDALKQELVIADMLYWLGSEHQHKYLKTVLPYLIHRAIQSHSKSLLQVLLYYSIVGPIHGSKSNPTIYQLQIISSVCSLEELLVGVGCLCTIKENKNNSRLNIPIFLKRSIFIKLYKAHDDKTLLLASKVLQKLDLRQTDYSYVVTLLNKLVKIVETMSLESCLSILSLAGALRIDHVGYLSAVIKKLSKQIVYLQIDVLCLVVRLVAAISSSKESQDFLEALNEELLKRDLPHAPFQYSYLKTNLCLLEHNILNLDLGKKCASDFKNKISLNDSMMVAEGILGAASLLEVFHSNDYLQLNSDEKFTLYNKLQHHYQNSAARYFCGVDSSVLNVLKNITVHIATTNILPYMYHDFVLCTDKHGSFLPVTYLHGMKPWQVKHIPESALQDGMRFTAIWLVPTNGRKFSNELTSSIRAKQKALKKLGYRTVQVDVATWLKAASSNVRSNQIWLSSMIQSAIFLEP